MTTPIAMPPTMMTPSVTTPVPKTLALSIAIVFGVGLAPAADAARKPRNALAEDGVECHAHPEPLASGETHWCDFVPRQVGRRDFSKPNARAGYVVSVLGPDCEAIEILGEEDATGADGSVLRRVHVLCAQ
jgi:hypothetical protein